MSLRMPTLLVSLLSLAACDGALGSLESIRIGVLVDLNETAIGSLGNDTRDAAILAVEQINASGGLFDGRKIDIVIGDVDGDPNDADLEGRRLIEEEGVVAIVGPLRSDSVADICPSSMACRSPRSPRRRPVPTLRNRRNGSFAPPPTTCSKAPLSRTSLPTAPRSTTLEPWPHVTSRSS